MLQSERSFHMPYINTKVSVSVSKEKEESIKKKLGEAIGLIPGKSEQWLMVSMEENCSLYFKGSDEKPMAFVEVKLFGKSTKDAYQKVTARITSILQEELAIPAECIYITYTEVEHWGWNGNNF